MNGGGSGGGGGLGVEKMEDGIEWNGVEGTGGHWLKKRVLEMGVSDESNDLGSGGSGSRREKKEGEGDWESKN